MHHPTHRTIKAAYSFYNVAKTVPLIRLMTDALILAKKVLYKLFNETYSLVFVLLFDSNA